MEANEAMRRIFWRHRWLLIALVLIPVAAITPLRLAKPVTYAATASIQAQAAAPDADTQVAAILARATAEATSPQVVQAAISAAGVNRNALTVARHEVAVASLGTSAIVTMTVTDSSRPVAMAIGRSLASAVVNALNGLGTQSSMELAALAKVKAQLDGARNSLVKQLGAANARNESAATSPGVQSLIAQLNEVDAQLLGNQTAVQQILTTSSTSQGAGVISAPTYATGVSRQVAVDGALAGLLGLVIAMLIATIRELARPTIAEPGAAARELGLALLGSAQLAKDGAADLDDELTTRLDLAAHRLGASTLVLTGPVPPAQLTALAGHINEDLPASADPVPDDGPGRVSGRVSGITALSSHIPGGTGDSRSPTGYFASITPHPRGVVAGRSGLLVVALPDRSLQARRDDPALVLVLPRFASRAALDQVVDLGVITGWPILGVIGLRKRAGRRHWRPEQEQPGIEAAAQPAATAAAIAAGQAVPDDQACPDDQAAPEDESVPDGKTADDEKATAGKKAQHLGAAI